MEEPDFKFKNSQKVDYLVYLKKPRECEGICYNPQDEKPKIFINPRGKRGLLNTSIHEFAHAFFWESTETNVFKFANVVSKFLYQQGWRQDEKLKPDKPKVPKRKTRKNS